MLSHPVRCLTGDANLFYQVVRIDVVHVSQTVSRNDTGRVSDAAASGPGQDQNQSQDQGQGQDQDRGQGQGQDRDPM